MDSAILVNLLLAHVVGDYYLQTDKLCARKESLKLRSPFLYAHAAIIGLLSWAAVPMVDFLPYFIAITISHLAIDAVKVSIPKGGLWPFIADQAAHLAVIVAAACMYTTSHVLPLQALSASLPFSLSWLSLALLLCWKPANIFIKLILTQYQVGASDTCEEMKNAGALIGNLERTMTIVFVMLGRFEAIGFIIAAKSILRFKDTNTAKTEYVLAGTFLSFGIAILCGLLATLR